MFCPNCAQCFDSLRQHECPICGFRLGLDHVDELENGLIPNSPTALPEAPADGGAMDAGIRKSVGLIVIAVGFFLVYKILVFFYPPTDTLIPGTTSVSLFQAGGQAILGLLFGAGVLRAIYALTLERKRDLRNLPR